MCTVEHSDYLTYDRSKAFVTLAKASHHGAEQMTDTALHVTRSFPHTRSRASNYEGKSLNKRKCYTRNNFFTRVLTEIVCVLFFDIVPCFATHLVHLSTSLRMPSRKKMLFGVAFNQLCTAPLPRRHL